MRATHLCVLLLAVQHSALDRVAGHELLAQRGQVLCVAQNFVAGAQQLNPDLRRLVRSFKNNSRLRLGPRALLARRVPGCTVAET